jgi:hypothetical protein
MMATVAAQVTPGPEAVLRVTRSEALNANGTLLKRPGHVSFWARVQRSPVSAHLMTRRDMGVTFKSGDHCARAHVSGPCTRAAIIARVHADQYTQAYRTYNDT